MEMLVNYTNTQVKNNITKEAIYNLLTMMYQQQGILINHRMEIMVSYIPRYLKISLSSKYLVNLKFVSPCIIIQFK
jgi:hypothetical protein